MFALNEIPLDSSLERVNGLVVKFYNYQNVYSSKATCKSIFHLVVCVCMFFNQTNAHPAVDLQPWESSYHCWWDDMERTDYWNFCKEDSGTSTIHGKNQ